MADTGRIQHPDILTDLCSHHQVLHIGTVEQDFAPHQNIAVLPGNCHRLFKSRIKVAQLIEFRIVRQAHFGNKGKQLPVLNGGGCIIELVIILPRNTGKYQHIASCRKIHQLFQFFPGLCEKRFLVKQFPACISGQNQLRKYHDFGSAFPSLYDSAADLLSVIFHIRYFYFRC